MTSRCHDRRPPRADADRPAGARRSCGSNWCGCGSGPYINDVDLALRLVRREADYDEHKVLARRRIREAQAAGRQFSNIVDQMFWPNHEVRLFLKSRSQVLSLHDLDDDEGVIMASPHKTIYEDKGAAKLPVA